MVMTTFPNASEPADSSASTRPPERPVRLAWTDPEEGETLWVELWGTREFVADLVAQGFEVRAIAEDETASSLCVRIQQRS